MSGWRAAPGRASGAACQRAGSRADGHTVARSCADLADRVAGPIVDVEHDRGDAAAVGTARVVADLLGLVPDERLDRAYTIVGELPKAVLAALLAEAATRSTLARAETDAPGAGGVR